MRKRNHSRFPPEGGDESIMGKSGMPDPVADDAPRPDDFSDGATVEYPGSSLTDVVAVDHDGARFCRECANPEYVELCKWSDGSIPHGGPVERGSEVDCPGHACDNCHRKITDLTVLHYEGVCHPATCPEMDADA